MEERELDRASEAWPDDFVTDLAKLSNNDLRKKYRREESSHRNRKNYCHREGWYWDEAWNDFRSFLRDMGPMPQDARTLDRLDHKLQRYGPGLCRWATKAEQTKNRKNTRYVDYRGDRLTIAEFASQIGKPYKTVHSALSRGISPERIAAPPSGLFDHLYCPMRYIGNEGALAAWYSRYEQWLKYEVPKSKRGSLRPELWDLMQCSAAYKRGHDWLTHRGYFEMTPADAQSHVAALEKSTEGQHYLHGFSWIEHALDTLRQTDPETAEHFRPRAGWTPFDYHEFAKTFLPTPQPDRFKRSGWHSEGYDD